MLLLPLKTSPAPSGYQHAAFARKRFSGAYLCLSAEHFTSVWAKRGKFCPAEVLLLSLMWEDNEEREVSGSAPASAAIGLGDGAEMGLIHD